MCHKGWHSHLGLNTPCSTLYFHLFFCLKTVILESVRKKLASLFFSLKQHFLECKSLRFARTPKGKGVVCMGLFFSLSYSAGFISRILKIQVCHSNNPDKSAKEQVQWPQLSAEKPSSPPWEEKNRHSGSLETAAMDNKITHNTITTTSVLCSCFLKVTPVVFKGVSTLLDGTVTRTKGEKWKK